MTQPDTSVTHTIPITLSNTQVTYDLNLVVVITPACPATISFDLTTSSSSFLQLLPYIIGEGEKKFTYNTTDVIVSD